MKKLRPYIAAKLALKKENLVANPLLGQIKSVKNLTFLNPSRESKEVMVQSLVFVFPDYLLQNLMETHGADPFPPLWYKSG